MKFLNRSLWMTLALLVGLNFQSALAKEAKYTIKFSHVVSENTPKGKAANYLAEQINKKMAGKVKMEVFPNSQLYDDDKVIEAMRLSTSATTGIMGAPSLSKFVKFSQTLQAFDLPFLFDSLEDVHVLVDSPVVVKMTAPLTSKGIQALAFWDSGMKVFSIRGPKALIDSPLDFRGKKFRIQTSDVHEAMILSLGGVPQKLPFKEVYTSLSQGVVDGQENSWSNIYSKKFHEAQDWITVSNHSYLGYLLVVSDAFWRGLPADIRKELEVLIREATLKAREFAAEADAADIASIMKDNRAKIVALPPKKRAQWKKATAGVEQKFSKEIGEDILKEIHATLDEARAKRATMDKADKMKADTMEKMDKADKMKADTMETMDKADKMKADTMEKMKK